MENLVGEHVLIYQLVDDGNGPSRLDDSVLPYESVLGPLRQSAVIEASAIRFHCWPGDYAGPFPRGEGKRVVLVTEGGLKVESSSGSRTFRPGEILELNDGQGTGHRVGAADANPFCACVISLEASSPSKDDTPARVKAAQSLPYVRNVTRDDQRSHFEDGVLAYYVSGDGSLVTDDIAISRFQYVYAGGNLNFDFHNAPQRQIVVPLTGGIRGENGDGTQREVPPGGVYFGEDTTGQGHITRALNNEIRFSIFAHLV